METPSVNDYKAIIDELRAQNAACLATIAKKDEEIDLLRAELRLLKHKLFGSSSEKKAAPIDEDQGLLFDIPKVEPLDDEDRESEDDELQTVAAHTRRRTGRKPLPSDLPRVEIIHDIADDEKTCACGTELERIGEESSERLVYVPAQLYVERHVRPKYACRVCEGTEDAGPAVRIAPLPPRLLPKSIATPSLLAHILTAKFVDATPFYRQEKQFARLGIEMNRTTMCTWAMKVADACEPLIAAIDREIRSGPLINADETTVQVLKEAGRSPTDKSYMWVFRGGARDGPALRYLYAPTRSASVAESYLLPYQGVVQTDGYKGYDFLSKQANISHVGCWAHARRKFVEVTQAQEKAAAGKKQAKRVSNAEKAIRLIGKLYTLEHKLRARELSDDEFVVERKGLVGPVLDELEKFLKELEPKTPPMGLLGKAISYALKHWPQLTAYLDYGFVTPDNNLIENAIRPFVVGRKNWLFSGHAKGAQASARLYSLIETAKANGLEPFKYLQYIFEKLPFADNDADIEALLPQRLSPQDIMDAQPPTQV